ncbi:MAG: transglutaminase family protein [Bryobacterales bacterium]|nr:transglutaminase family protein [Bryobacterales bacterium]
MAISVALHHKTTYRYDRLVSLSPHIIRLRPAPHCRTPVPSYSLKVKPEDHFINWQQDPQSNYLARLVFPEKTRELEVEVDLIAEMSVINPFDFFLEPKAEKYPFQYDHWLDRELKPFLELGADGPHLQKFLAETDLRSRQIVDFLVDINQRIQKAIGYVIRMEPGVQTCEQTLELSSGSCRDSAWLLVQVLRRLGLAARFVSGYLIQLKPDVKSLDGPSGAEEDFTDLHAWTEVYLPGAGWVGLDPTSGLFAAEGHLPVAATPDPQSAAPISGAVDPAEVEFHHEMKVTRIREDPRVTKPHSEQQWEAITQLGHRVDADLERQDVRLTMGGEPTFVSIDDMEGDEWNTAALGERKRILAEQLIKRLRDRYAPGGLLHYGQGKWYPGEPLPRWALTCYWRTDGHPLWTDPDRIADTEESSEHGLPEAEAFTRSLAGQLGVDPDYAISAYEDPAHYLHKEGRLPVNVSPEDNKLDRADERERLKRVYETGFDSPSGYVLPLQRKWAGAKRVWQSGMWMLRGKQLFLIPGDSPIGLRLPLPSLPWVDERHAQHPMPVDPFADRNPLAAPTQQPRHAGQEPPAPKAGQAPVDRWPSVGESAPWVVRTAIAIQPRDGRVHVFFPPLESADDFVDLLQKVEDASAETDTKVVIEGYTPPSDPRLASFKITPDPGVIEVNVQPVRTWDELVSNTVTLYEDARQCRLGTEKFMLDGRHTGSGGGNHFVMGGPSAPDSPFLRRPDLLRSLVSYWNNHPSLSYLFSGLFIGPTSQAPRVDETRIDALPELEIAFEQIDQAGPNCPPWLVDRIFRHLLVDVTGNTHRAEFCIDKLYAPESSTGRLGLVELRSFEMPPHARMSLAQQLLLRALIAWFWRSAYKRMPVHWGTRLHDQFMLPHFIERDFAEIIDDLRGAGYPFQLDWFDAQIEFRYPRIGRVVHAGIDLELRVATEPWYVLGEEPAGGGTSRFVDSSVERLQVKVKGFLADRYSVRCNHRRIPLRPAGTENELVAGVRYRAWQPPSCLHPTIGVHTPLTFDIVDEWSQRSIGGCVYHVGHPGGRNYETFPVNSYEADARRASRFFSIGHTPGKTGPAPEEKNPRFPYTLDLRRGQTH